MSLLVPYNVKPTPVTPDPGANFIVAPDKGAPLFLGDPKLSDIAQGTIADCAFLSALIAILHRPSGMQFIQNMMVEDPMKGVVTVRLYEAGKPIYLQTPKCRVKNVAANKRVSERSVCWPDVLEVCASIFSMKAALNAPTRTPQATLENLNLAIPAHTLSVLTGAKVVSREIADERPLDVNKNFGYGMLLAVFDRSKAPDQTYRDDCVNQAFGNENNAWNTWAGQHSDVWESYIRQHRSNDTVGVTVKTNIFEGLLPQVPANFHAGLRELDRQNRFVQGHRMEAKFTQSQDDYFARITNAIQDSFPMVLVTRSSVGRAGSTTSPLGEDMYLGILGGHCYGVERTRVSPTSGMKFVDITNPWGKYVRGYDPGTGKPVPVTEGGPRGAGRFSVTLHELLKKFEHYAYSPQKLSS